MMSAVKNLYDYTIGGYPEELFLDIREDEKVLLECSICYLVSRDPRECTSGHIFCTSCIVAWATGEADGSSKCPVCRVPGRYYRPSARAHYVVSRKTVRCPEFSCQWVGILRDYKYHKKERHSSVNSPIEGLVPIQLFLKSRIYGRRRNSGEEPSNNFAVTADGGVIDNGDVRPHRDDNAHDNNVVHNGHFNRSSAESVDTDLQMVQQELRSMSRAPVGINPRQSNGRPVFAREDVAKESLEEVESIRKQLSKVSGDLSQLLLRMNRDHEKYMGFINSRPPEPVYLPESFNDDQRLLRQHADRLHSFERGAAKSREPKARAQKDQIARPLEQVKGKRARPGRSKTDTPSMALTKGALAKGLFKREIKK